MFHKTVRKAWNLFNISEQSLEKFSIEFSFWVSIDWEVLSIEKSIRSIEQKSNSDRIIQKLQDFFFNISINQAKVSTDRKCLTSNFHFEKFQNLNFHFNNFTKQYFQTQTSSLLQPILVYTHMYNTTLVVLT